MARIEPGFGKTASAPYGGILHICSRIEHGQLDESAESNEPREVVIKNLAITTLAMLALASFVMPLSAQKGQKGGPDRRVKVHQVKKHVAERRAQEQNQEHQGNQGNHENQENQQKGRPGQERVREFLKEHPKLRREVMSAADRDGDGKLSPEERKLAWRILKHKRKDLIEKWEQRQERREEFKEKHPDAGKRLHQALDLNGDGKVGPKELERGRKIHDRLDRNDDGKVGPKERHHAKEVHETLQRKKAEEQPKPLPDPRPRPKR